MNYLAELKAFYDTLAINSLSSPDIALWYALLSIANRSGWKTEFTVALSVLAFYSGSNESSVKRSRNKLMQCGYITYRSRKGNQSAVYHINSLVVHSEPQIAPQSGLQCVPQTVPQSVPINKTKLNETNIPPISPTGFNSFWEAYPKKVRILKAEEAYRQILFEDSSLEEKDVEVAACNYAEAVRIMETEDRYILNPENFLLKGVYADYLPGTYKKPQRTQRDRPSEQFNQFMQTDYDFEALEKELLGEGESNGL